MIVGTIPVFPNLIRAEGQQDQWHFDKSHPRKLSFLKPSDLLKAIQFEDYIATVSSPTS